jgi:iron complex outermembrane receptor protein
VSARHRSPHRHAFHGLILLTCLTHVSPAGAQTSPGLKHLTIEELMDLDVTTAQRRIEPVRFTPAAITVLTNEDLRRAGVTTLADALQLVDGVYFARLNNSGWRIGARGLNGATPNKLLVMIDGRALYSSLFTGVFWNVVSYVLEDIDRIEVIRGPGAALWGANAVHGVVNIITRHSRDTQGTYALLAAGNEDRAVVEARHGGRAGAATWRAYVKAADRDDQRLASGSDAIDARRRGQVGFRIDGGSAQASNWMLIGDVVHSREGFVERRDGEYTEVALHGRWSQPIALATRLDVQSFYRREYRRAPTQLTHSIDLFDVDAQHSGTFAARHHLVWGGGFRVSQDETYGNNTLRFEPPQRTYALTSVFAQDEIALVPNSLFAIVGGKYEHNAFSGGEIQPNVRMRWLIDQRQMLWGAASRAVRRPTRLDEDVIVSGASGDGTVVGNPDFLPESVIATELGYRAQLSLAMSIDVTVFHHDIDDLRSQDAPVGGGLPLMLANTLEGETRGMELAAKVQPFARWRTHVGYTWMDTDIRRSPGSRDVSGGASEANDPHHLFLLRTSVDLARTVELDAMFRSSGALPNPSFPGYSELNLRLGWQATRHVELSVSGQDLLHDQHPELPPSASGTEVERAVRFGVALRY